MSPPPSSATGPAQDDMKEDDADFLLEEDDSNVELQRVLMSQHEKSLGGADGVDNGDGDGDATNVDLQRVLIEEHEQRGALSPENAQPETKVDSASPRSSPDLDLPDVSQILADNQQPAGHTTKPPSLALSCSRGFATPSRPTHAIRQNETSPSDDDDQLLPSGDDDSKEDGGNIPTQSRTSLRGLKKTAEPSDQSDALLQSTPSGRSTAHSARPPEAPVSPAISRLKSKNEPGNTPDRKAVSPTATPVRASYRLSQNVTTTPSGSKSRKRRAKSPASQGGSPDSERRSRTRRRVEPNVLDTAVGTTLTPKTAQKSTSSSNSKPASSRTQSGSSTARTSSDPQTATQGPSGLVIKPPLSTHSFSQPVFGKSSLSPSAPRPTPKHRAQTQLSPVQDIDVKLEVPKSASSTVFPRMTLASTSSLLSQAKDEVERSASQRSRRGSISKAARITRHEEFWHLDGSVVVLIETIAFKLHRSRLSVQSEFFKRLFSNSPPPQAIAVDIDGASGSNAEDNEVQEVNVPMFSGCPLYTLTNVTVQDFVELLKAEKLGIAYAFNPPPSPILAAILRAAYALEFGTILEFATHRLQALWPSDLAQLTPDSIPHAAEAIVLARQCNLPQVCKRAFYELLRSPSFEQEADGDNDEDDDNDMYVDEQEEAGRRLQHADLVRLISTREKLRSEWLRVVCTPPVPSVVPCPLEQIPSDMRDPEREPELVRCRATREKNSELWMRAVLNGPTLVESGTYDPLCALQTLCDMDWADMGYCHGCVGARRELWGEKREKLWKDLDAWLGLPMATA